MVKVQNTSWLDGEDKSERGPGKDNRSTPKQRKQMKEIKII